MIGIIDYGLGNLTSVAGAVSRLGYEPIISASTDELKACDKLILPGVGAFGDGMANLHARNLVEPLTEMVKKGGKPILGICLGFQLLGLSSTEFGDHQGLGWVGTKVSLLTPADKNLRVPHVGWNELTPVRDCILFDDVPDDALFYYVHSYKMELEADAASMRSIVGTCDYGGPFAAVLQKGSIFGTQFHPEKSQRHGLTVLGNFLEKA